MFEDPMNNKPALFMVLRVTKYYKIGHFTLSSRHNLHGNIFHVLYIEKKKKTYVLCLASVATDQFNEHPIETKIHWFLHSS